MVDRAFVIGLSGIPGSGKTTLMRLLLRDYSPAEAIYYDRFHPGVTEAQINDWFARTGNPNELPLSDLISELTRRTQIRPDDRGRPLVLFETAFGRAHAATGAFIDFSIWIDTPLDIALARACLVFVDTVKRDQAPNAATDFIAWLTRYMGDYPILRAMYLTWRERLAATADLILDGTQPAEASADAVQKALAARGIGSTTAPPLKT